MSTRPQRVLRALQNLHAQGVDLKPPKRRKTDRELTQESLEEVRKVLHEDDDRGFRIPDRGRKGQHP